MTQEIFKKFDVLLYEPRGGGRVNIGKCRADVGQGYHGCQCANTAKNFRLVEGHGPPLGFCGTHDPLRVRERREKRSAAWRAKIYMEASERKTNEDLKVMQKAALDAIQQIADGHNDPRALALTVLGDRA